MGSARTSSWCLSRSNDHAGDGARGRGDRVVVETRVVSLRTASSERETVILNADTGVRLAQASNLWAFIDLAAGRAVRIPADVRALFVIERSVLHPSA